MTNVGAGKSPSVICKEVFDEGYQPSNEEIREYALRIGIDPKREFHLLPIAKDGLMRALPRDWQICFHEPQVIYYVNAKTKERQWEHPLDAEYKKLVERARLTHPNADLSEETSLQDSGIKSLQGTENSEILTDPSIIKEVMDNTGSNGGNIGNRFLAPIEKKGLVQLETVRNNRFEVTNYANSGVGQIDLNIKSEESTRPLTFVGTKKIEKEVNRLTLSGTGSMFLKSNTNKKMDDKSNARPKDFDWGNSNTYSGHGNVGVKGILRDSSLTDVRNKNVVPRPNDFDIEDRKSVRFDLERSTQIENRDSSEDDCDEWDFMEGDGVESHVKEVTVTLSKDLALKPPLQPQHSLDDARKPTNRLASLGRTLSHDGGTEIKPIHLSTMFDRQKSSLIRPLYEDTDSESGGGSVIGISKNTLLNTQHKFNGEIDELLEKDKLKSQMKQRLDRFKSNLFDRQQAEERTSNEETHQFSHLKQGIGGQNNMDKITTELKHETDSGKSVTAMELERSMTEKRMQETLTQEKENLKIKFEAQRAKLELDHQNELSKLAETLKEQIRDLKIELESQHNFDVEKFSQRLKDEFQCKTKEIGHEHRGAVEILQRNHAEILQDLERDLKSEEEIVKKDHATTLAQLKDKLTHELELERQRMRESGESHLFEKMRCEKRLLEDKYRCLKEKYVRLKADVKISLERRSRRRDHQSITTGSETERSNSNKQSAGSSDVRSTSISGPHLGQGRPPTAPSTPKLQIKSRDKLLDKSIERDKEKPSFGAAAKYLSHVQHYHDDTTSISQSDTTVSNNLNRIRYLPIQPTTSDNGNSESETFTRNKENNNVARDNEREAPGRQRKKIFTRAKSASTSRLNTMNRSEPPRPCTPVENLRRQLQKLEDLEDQFPDNTLDTTYHLRYPFTDVGKDHAGSSSELEFFKHRIHLERDSVRRAKDSLRTQRTNFRARQREIKQRHKSTTRHTLDQLIQEEKELTEMEVNLHRTRALLGEKVIRLRHLEQSLKRVYEKEKAKELSTDDSKTRKDDATISDLSSHSSSGFSSTDFGSDTNNHDNVRRHKEIYQESSDIIQSLEHLNAEIREIWEILSKQQAHGLPPPPSMLYSEINWSHMMNTTATSGAPQPIVHQAQPMTIPTLADRLETYRQLAANRTSPTTAAPTVSGLMSTLAANMIVSQSPSGYTTSLVERTQDLRNWLRLAKNEHELLSNGQQANL